MAFHQNVVGNTDLNLACLVIVHRLDVRMQSFIDLTFSRGTMLRVPNDSKNENVNI